MEHIVIQFNLIRENAKLHKAVIQLKDLFVILQNSILTYALVLLIFTGIQLKFYAKHRHQRVIHVLLQMSVKVAQVYTVVQIVNVLKIIFGQQTNAVFFFNLK